ncbi:MAG TPA: nucleoside-diphosphate sugar epimerase/dehydratase [Chryseosolibacter sp.]
MAYKLTLFGKSLMGTIYRLKILPRWVIILIDLSFISLSTCLGFFLRFNFSKDDILAHNFVEGIFINALAGLISILLTNSYKGIVRYTGIQDGVRIFFTLLISMVIVNGVNLVYSYNYRINIIPYSVIFIGFLASFLFLFNYRLLVKYIFSFYNSNTLRNAHVLIYGAGQTGMITKHVIDASPTSKVIGFLENDRHKIDKVLNGSPIYSAELDQVEELIQNVRVDELIITVKNLGTKAKNEIVDLCFKYHVKVRVVPPIDKWVKGELSLNQIKEINIEDLLERESIKLSDSNLEQQLSRKKVCITGAAGSIGSEIVRQVMGYNPSQVILIDQAESFLFEIDRQIKRSDSSVQVTSYVADITNKERIRSIFNEHHPDLIFHAAAYKHVPLMERNPAEAITCNILGTKILADLAVEFGVLKFVMISTDKAVNPTNVMGCSKRIAEIYVQSLNRYLDTLGKPHTAFVTTRFGNVLGSNGSVIPVFKKQIDAGGPVTVTHPEITRYFMTIPEACQLVLEAGALGRGGEIFIFDMGEMVKIHDLAKRMIRLSGFEPGKEIDIVFTGLREGEKLYEELLNQSESTIPTHHDKIMIAKVQEYAYSEVSKMVDLFHELVDDKNELKMVALMKELVPEFKSNYSRYEVLDRIQN